MTPWVTFSELYRYCVIRLHVHMFGVGNSEFGNYCAVFGYCPIPNFFARKSVPHIEFLPDSNLGSLAKLDIVGQTAGTIEDEELEVGYGSDRLNRSVFVKVVEVSQESKSIPLVLLRSLVRLVPINDCPISGSDASKISVFVTGIFSRSVKNRELQTTSLSFILTIEVANLENQQVQRGAKVMGEVTNNTAQLGRKRLAYIGNEGILRGLRVRLADKGIGIRLEEPLDSHLDGVQMLLCPAKFQMSFGEWMSHMLKYPQGETNARKETKDTQGVRDIRTQEKRLSNQSQEGRQALNSSQPSKVKSQTSPAPRSGDYISKHTHSGRIEDA